MKTIRRAFLVGAFAILFVASFAPLALADGLSIHIVGSKHRTDFAPVFESMAVREIFSRPGYGRLGSNIFTFTRSRSFSEKDLSVRIVTGVPEPGSLGLLLISLLGLVVLAVTKNRKPAFARRS